MCHFKLNIQRSKFLSIIDVSKRLALESTHFTLLKKLRKNYKKKIQGKNEKPKL